jgi:hypothetical protein
MKKNEGMFQKLFGTFGWSSRVPVRSNIFKGAGSRGYTQIGGTGRGYGGQRQSPLLGNAGASNLLSA